MTRGMGTGCAVVAALGLILTEGAAAADLIAGWHFNGLAAPVSPIVGSQQGSGTLDLTAFTSGLSWQTGTDLNAWPGDPAGEGLGFTGAAANGKSAVFIMGTLGSDAQTFSLAARATGTGHLQSVVEAWNGAEWSSVGGFTLTASVWSTASFDLSGLGYLDNGVATLRLRLEGASSSQGNFRIDNVRLEGTAVPAPGVLALAGTALATARRRRR